MAATPVPAFSAPPDFPALSDRAAGTYNTKAYAWAIAWQSTTGPNVYAMAESARLNALEAKAQTDTAVAAGTQASTAAATALAASNFKGEWSFMAGALNKPACVKHNGRFWILLNNLGDVTTSEPGVSADWTSLDAGRVTQTITSSTTAVPGVYYIATTAGITLTIPSGWLSGDSVGGRNASGGACAIAWGANTILGEAPQSPMTWPSRGRFETTYSGSTFA